jgi:hypothetical protein
LIPLSSEDRFPHGVPGKLTDEVSETGPLLIHAVPAFAAELEDALREAARPDLADQVAALRVRQVCRCEVEGCASFYAAMPMRRWFRRGKQLAVGELVVDTIDGEIVYVEVLGRPDVRAALRR